MAKPVTARELARAATNPAADKASLEPIKILEFVGFVLLLLIAAWYGWQAYDGFARAAGKVAIEQHAEQLSVDVKGFVGELNTRFRQTLSDPAFVEATKNPDPEIARTEIRRLLTAKLPEHVDASILLGADVLAGLQSDIERTGFARVGILRDAEGESAFSPLQLLLDANGVRRAALAAAIREGTQTLGFVLAFFPIDQVEQKFSRWDGMGRIELRQGKRDDYEIYSMGDRDVFMKREDRRLVIDQSDLRVAYALREAFVQPTLGNGALLAIALASLIGALVLLVMRIRPGIAKRLGESMKRKDQDAKAALPVTAPSVSAEASESPPPMSTITEPKASTSKAPEPAVAVDFKLPAVPVERSIFRAYDIRGVVGKTLSQEVAHLIGRAIGSEVRARGLKEVAVARDGRLSGPDLMQGLVIGLRAAGCNVIDIGMVPTPMLYFATFELNTGCGVMLTGSHNPPDYNGFKIMIGGETLAEQAIQDLYARISTGNFSQGQGSMQSLDVSKAYVDRISSDIQVESPLKVVVDCGNGVAGVIAETLLQAIGCEVTPLYCDVDGEFPNHHPDPSEPHNLQDLIISTQRTRADIGVAFDGDGDRLGVVTPQGKIIYPDRMLMAFAQDVLTRNPGASIIFDVKCTGQLGNVIRAAGGVPIMWRTGHSLIKHKMRETGAELAGEMSGHFFFKERWFGFDDGLYAACRMLEILAASGLSVDELFEELPDSVSTPELKVPMREGEHYQFMEKFKAKASFPRARITTIDGIRADFEDGWGLVRPSNTTPILVLRFDASNEAALERIKTDFRAQLLSIDKNLQLPF
jgi:phosphomannomutase/phosphoglucomutase